MVAVDSASRGLSMHLTGDEIRVIDPVVSRMFKAWDYWQLNRDGIPDYGFQEWMRNEYGFTYTGHQRGPYDLRVTVTDPAKFAWFLLKW
jgi:hypothetical protein